MRGPPRSLPWPRPHPRPGPPRRTGRPSTSTPTMPWHAGWPRSPSCCCATRTASCRWPRAHASPSSATWPPRPVTRARAPRRSTRPGWRPPWRRLPVPVWSWSATPRATTARASPTRPCSTRRSPWPGGRRWYWPTSGWMSCPNPRAWTAPTCGCRRRRPGCLPPSSVPTPTWSPSSPPDPRWKPTGRSTPGPWSTPVCPGRPVPAPHCGCSPARSTPPVAWLRPTRCATRTTPPPPGSRPRGSSPCTRTAPTSATATTPPPARRWPTRSASDCPTPASSTPD